MKSKFFVAQLYIRACPIAFLSQVCDSASVQRWMGVHHSRHNLA